MMAIHHARVVPPGAARATRLGGLGANHLVEATALGGALAMVEHPLEPRSLGAPVHTHANEDEVSYVLEGTFGFMLGDREFEAGPGSTVVKPRGVPHAFWNATGRPARLLDVIAPAGFERFFDEIAPLFPAEGEPEEEALVTFGGISSRFGLRMELDSIPRLMERHRLLRA